MAPTPPPAAACAGAIHNPTPTLVAEGTITDQEMTGVAGRLGAALDRYRLATSAPHPAGGFQSHWQTVRGVDIHDRASLASPDSPLPVVMVHGLAVSHRYLMPLAAKLAGHHRVHAVDLPGFGFSGEPGRVLDVAEHAEHLADWLERAGLPAPAVLGNSFGCQVAVHLAACHPDRVRGLILVGPTMDPAARTASRQILRWLRDTAREDPLQLPILLRDVRDAGPHRVVGTLARALRDPIEDKLPLVEVPVLVTRGSREPIVPMVWAQAATRLLPLGELSVVPGPHNANYGAADHLSELVLAFLRQRVLTQDDQAPRRDGTGKDRPPNDRSNT
jgi:pimeloyl-ACP methyl ester carboxylesterase